MSTAFRLLQRSISKVIIANGQIQRVKESPNNLLSLSNDELLKITSGSQDINQIRTLLAEIKCS